MTITDKDRLLTFLTGAGYTRTDEDDSYNMDGRVYYEGGPGEHQLDGPQKPRTSYVSSLRVGHGIGYSGFFCEFFFDSTGALLCHGTWE